MPARDLEPLMDAGVTRGAGTPAGPTDPASGAFARSGPSRRTPRLLLILAGALLLARVAAGILDDSPRSASPVHTNWQIQSTGP